MKIRIEKNSIRYRLKQPEVEFFKKNGGITEVLQLGINEEQQLSFSLVRSEVHTLMVQTDGNSTVVFVPHKIASDWTESDQVGFDCFVQLSNEKVLKILVEKDFECLDRSEEENIGAYPNPARHC